MYFKKLPSNYRDFYSYNLSIGKNNDRNIEGFDTETDSNGNILVLASSRFHTSYRPSVLECLSFLSKNDFNQGWFFNIGFDVDAIFKPIADKIDFEKKGFWNVKIGKYQVKYLKGKMLYIKTKKGSKYFFDVNNFYEGSLSKVSRDILGMEKTGENFNKNFMENENFDEVVKYCMNDAYLTKELAKILFTGIENISKDLIGVRSSPRRLLSRASLAEFYLIKKIPFEVLRPMYDFEILNYGYKAYHGGMFDLYERGLLSVDTIDLKSAYPYEISNLIDLSRGEWKYVKNFDENAYYGFYHVKIKYNGFIPLQLKNGNVIYPVTEKRYEYYATQNELKNFKDWEVIDGYVFYPSKIIKPFKPLIDYLFDLKERNKENKVKYLLIKKIINSMYGKFVQIAGDKTGKIFNSVYGAVITSNTRLKIYEGMKLFDKIYEIDTDSISGKLKNGFISGKNLGEFELKEKNSEKIIIENGISLTPDLKTFFNTRGFSKSQIQNFKIKNDKIIINFRRPLHMREAKVQKKLYEINKFEDFTKEISLVSTKKLFPSEWNLVDVQEGVFFGDEIFNEV